MTAKQKVLEAVKSMPDSSTYEQIALDLAILQSIEESKEKNNRVTADQVRESTTKAIEKAMADSKQPAHG